MAGLMQSLSVVVDAAAFSSSDKQKLLALVQSQQGSDDSELGAPEPAAYSTHSSSILDVLEDLKEKAEGELSDLRKAEVTSKHNFAMVKQSLEDQIAADTKDLDAEKSSKAAYEETKANAEGDLNATTTALKTAEEDLASTTTTCEQVAADSEATIAARAEEMKVIEEAIEVLESMTTGAVEQTYSLLQLMTSRSSSKLQTRADLANSEVINLVKKLARKHHSAALAQLASRIAAVVQYGSAGGEDPFAKVKGLIQELIERLKSEASAEATEKAYCDEEMAASEQKKSDLSDGISKLTTKIDQAAARSSQLKEEVSVLQAALAGLLKSQSEMDTLRSETHAAYVKAKAELEEGLTGVRKALTVLREYYSKKKKTALVQVARVSIRLQQPALPEKHDSAKGSATSIIGILEVLDSDFAENLAKEEMQEADAQSAYEKMTQENKIAQATKQQDVTYKTKEAAGLDKSIAEVTSDRETMETELAAVDEYFAALKERCIAKPETYESRKERREAEIAGLKEALAVLEGEAAFVQRKRHGLHAHFLAQK